MDLKNLPKTEFAAAVAQIAGERGVDPQAVVSSIELALVAAYKRDAKEHGTEVPEEQVFAVELNPQTGEFRVFEVNDTEKKDVTPPGFGRIAAQTAKQVIMQKIREAERDIVLAEYTNRLGTIINGLVIRVDPFKVVVGIGKTEGILPKEEQVPGKTYQLSQTMPLLLKEIKEEEETGRKNIIMSDSSPDLVVELFRREVPEVASGSVVVKKIVRRAGQRTKIAVFSVQPGVDPVGSCVGQKGNRVQSVLRDLPENEKVDIIPYYDDTKQFITSSLSPAEGARVVKTDEASKLVTVMLPEDQLALAIGEGGENIRLAGTLTGWELKVVSQKEWETKQPPKPVKPTTRVKKVATKQVAKVKKTKAK